MQNFDISAASSLEIFLTSKERAEVEIFVYTDSRTINVTVEPGITHREVIRAGLNNPFAAEGSGNVERKAIRITSDVDISVYALNSRNKSADAAVILPFGTLGNQYYVSAYWEEYPAGDTFNSNNNGQDDSPSSFLIVAAANDTKIDITPSVDIRGGPNVGETFEVTLDQGDIYQIQADADLTGTLIQLSEDNSGVCKNFAVFGGNQWGRVTGGDDCAFATNLGGFAADQLYEQMFPVSTWGKNYIAVPYELRTAYVLQITASEDDTELVIGTERITLDAGESLRRLETDVVSMSATKPIQVAQLSQTLSCDNNSNTGPGDPFMIMLSPNEQKLKEITFNALTTPDIEDYFVTIITETSDISEIRLNGQNVDETAFTVVPGTGFSQATVEIDKGADYTMISDEGFIAYIYGFGNIESFGYVAGASLENLNLEIVADDEEIDIITQEGCVDNLVDFELDFEVPPGENPRFDTFEWDFGDGNVADGQNVTHTYDTPGDFIVTVRASEGGACGTSETVVRTIKITENEITALDGPPSVCPDVTQIEYTVEGAPGQTYTWDIRGGTIVSNSNDRILVDWHAARNDAFVSVFGTNTTGCRTDLVTLDVIINKRLEPADPLSDSFIAPGSRLSEVCYTDRNRVRYFTPRTNGSNYSWTEEGGTFTADSDPSSNEVFVDWGDNVAGRIYYREFNPLINDCEGTSEITNVIIYQPIVSVPTITNALCNGDANGTISLALSGGKAGNYQVSWSNGMNGADISGLSTGDYIATITDALGCEIQEIYTVTEPDVLEVVDDQVINVRCFQEANGSVTLLVQGGTTFANGDYSFLWTGPEDFERTVNTNTINGLKAGSYDVLVTDANGCQTSTTVLVEQPPLLEADLETLISEPICPQASNGTTFIDAKGGTPAYQFFWSSNPAVDDQNASNLSQGTYTVTIVDANGCVATRDVDVVERFPRIFLPSAFSPNGDRTNDEFKPVTDCSIQFSMQIYNKWGSVVFSTEDASQGWDGTFEGQEAPSGKYSYVIFHSGVLNNIPFEETFRGAVKLIR